MTGISDLRMVWTMVRIERSSPPGVFSSTMSAWAPSARARSSAPLSRRAVMGPMAPSISMIETGGAAPAVEQANRTTRRKVVGLARRRRRVITASTRMIARGGALSAEREEREQLEEKVGGEKAGDLSRAVERRGDLDHVRPHEIEAAESPHQGQRLEGREAAHFRRAGRGRVGRVHGVDVEGAVDRPALELLEALDRPRGAALLDDLDPDRFEAVFSVEVEVVRSVERPADADLDHAAAVDQFLLDRPSEGGSVEVLGAEVLVPRVRMRVEVDQAQPPMPSREGPEDRKRDRMVASHGHRHHRCRDESVDLTFDRGEGALDGD